MFIPLQSRDFEDTKYASFMCHITNADYSPRNTVGARSQDQGRSRRDLWKRAFIFEKHNYALVYNFFSPIFLIFILN